MSGSAKWGTRAPVSRSTITVGLDGSRLFCGSVGGGSGAGSKPVSQAMSSGMLADQPSIEL